MGCTRGMFWHFTGEGCFEVWFLLLSFKKTYVLLISLCIRLYGRKQLDLLKPNQSFTSI